MSTSLEISTMLKGLADCYPRFDLQKATVTAYCSILQDVPIEALKAAARDYASKPNEFFPSAGTLRTIALEMAHGLNGEETGEEAWGRARFLMGRVGAAGSYDWDDDPIMRDTVQACGGWRYLCLSENIVADRARFIQTWEIIRKRRREDLMMPEPVRQLVGSIAKQLSSGADKPTTSKKRPV